MLNFQQRGALEELQRIYDEDAAKVSYAAATGDMNELQRATERSKTTEIAFRKLLSILLQENFTASSIKKDADV